MEERAYYFITFTTYGTHLPGDERGSIRRGRKGAPSRALAPSPETAARASALMAQPAFTLTEAQRQSVATTVREVCESKGWVLHALNVRTNHIHLLVSGLASPETVMGACKSWATRRMREQSLVGENARVWTRHGSTQYVKGQAGFERVADYILGGQGPDLGGVELGVLE